MRRLKLLALIFCLLFIFDFVSSEEIKIQNEKIIELKLQEKFYSNEFNTSEYVEVFFKLNDPLDADSLLSTLTGTEISDLYNSGSGLAYS